MRSLLTALSVAAAFGVTSSVTLVANEPRESISDQSIADHVEDELLFDPAVISEAIDVRSTNGIVSLDGSVDNLLAKERAACNNGTRCASVCSMRTGLSSRFPNSSYLLT